MRAAFRPEFLNRIDDIVLFNPLGREQLEKIVDLQLASVSKLLAERNVRIELTPAARALVLAEGYDPAYGARPLRRTVQRLVQDPLAMRDSRRQGPAGRHGSRGRRCGCGQMKFERVDAAESAAGRKNRSGRGAAASRKQLSGNGAMTHG